MLSQNLSHLRKANGMTQEALAEEMGVSRQSIAKWESGESIPDMRSCMALADFFNVSLDDLVYHSEEETGIIIAPKGKYTFGKVIVGQNGRIELPQRAREVFQIEEGDEVFLLGDEERGLAIVPLKYLEEFLGVVGIMKKK